MIAADVVVVGAGTAGSVLAARLSEDPARRVVLVEEGPIPASAAHLPAELLDARRVPGAETEGAFNRWFPVELTPRRDWRVSRGRVAGGSSATNGAYFVHARPADLADWSGGTGPWAPDALAERRAALERDLDLGAAGGHGDAGPVPVARSPLTHPAAEAFVAAATGAGHAFVADLNGADDHGVGPLPANAAAGVRWSAASTHLLPALGRGNLRIVERTAVHAVRLRRGRATGVSTARGEIAAPLVVLAAGALTTPAILLRSGVGPAPALGAAGVPAALDAPGVGGQLSDHPQVVVTWRPAAPLPRPEAAWAGALLDAPADAGGDLEVLQSLVPMGGLTRTDPGDGPLPLLVSAHARQAPGSLTLEPDGTVRIRQGYLRTAADRARLRQGARLAAEVAHGMRGEVDPGPAVLRDDAALDRWVAEHLGTALHACATVPWRLPDGAPGPVDEAGAVRGIDGLVVADTSILPTAPSRGPAATAFLIGEVVAAALR
ncbi:FAD-dependent oxidoreductase [Amnibacterium endophyticum]|uniref:FAD-dependent oxidoreductase n=1 Tax=Amnibacterium endophyticum TaxID=2109337 RepID=A0ABW4LH15_9MICO